MSSRTSVAHARCGRRRSVVSRRVRVALFT